MPKPEEELRESWFGKRVHASEPPLSLPPPRPRGRAASSTFALGVVAGAIGGAVALLLAGQMTHRFGPTVDVAQAVGHVIGRGAESGLAVAGLAGALLGGLLALTMQNARRWIGRLIFASTASVALWFLVHVALVARHRATLPLVPMLIGVAAYGACVAFVPASRTTRTDRSA